MLITAFSQVPDPRRGQGKRYELTYLLFFCILAILCNANSYRSIATFITTHFKSLRKRYKLKWKKPPAYSTIRRVIQNVEGKELEKSFRQYSKYLATQKRNKDKKVIQVAIDGKTIRGSFNHFQDKAAMQVLSAFMTGSKIILGHEETRRDKTNEIPLAQYLIDELGLKGCLISMDALHCQKKH